jgi:gamma-glutamylcyclotransferase (GGCT)/AIG2-like uncharacterized protein YtfP
MTVGPDLGSPFTLFVYGTLKRDGCRHHVLAGQRFLGTARTRPVYALFDFGDHPGLVACPAEGQAVEGELYEVAGEQVERLDQIEGAPLLFRLGLVNVEGYEGPVYAYYYQQATDGRPLCPDGRWDNRGPAAEGAGR